MTEPVLLALDYPGRREESTVNDLRLPQEGFEVRHLLREPFVREAEGARYAAALGPFDTDVTAVLAYCMAAPIAQEVAATVSAGRDPVPLVLFDAEPATASAISEQYGTVVDQMLEQVGGPAQPRSELVFPESALSERPSECVDQMHRSLVTLADGALRAGGAEDEAREIAEQVADFYLDWLTHLVAAHTATWPRWGGEVLHVVSREHAFTGDWPGARSTRVQRVEADRNGLLNAPPTREFVLSFLAGTA